MGPVTRMPSGTVGKIGSDIGTEVPTRPAATRRVWRQRHRKGADHEGACGHAPLRSGGVHARVRHRRRSGTLRRAEGGVVAMKARTLMAAAGALAAAAALSPPARRRYLAWGATPQEAAGPLPGDDLLPGADLLSTRAVSIDAPPSAVWPWLVQMGSGRG